MPKENMDEEMESVESSGDSEDDEDNDVNKRTPTDRRHKPMETEMERDSESDDSVGDGNTLTVV